MSGSLLDAPREQGCCIDQRAALRCHIRGKAGDALRCAWNNNSRGMGLGWAAAGWSSVPKCRQVRRAKDRWRGGAAAGGNESSYESIFFKLCCFRVVVVFRRVPLIASSKFNSGRNVDGSGWPREAVQHQRRRHAG